MHQATALSHSPGFLLLRRNALTLALSFQCGLSWLDAASRWAGAAGLAIQARQCWSAPQRCQPSEKWFALTHPTFIVPPATERGPIRGWLKPR